MHKVVFDPEYSAHDDLDMHYGLALAVDQVLDAISDGELSDQALFTLYKMSLKEAQERELVR